MTTSRTRILIAAFALSLSAPVADAAAQSMLAPETESSIFGSFQSLQEPVTPVEEAVPMASMGASQAGCTIERVTINGNQRIENETIRTYLRFKQGDELTDEVLNASIKSLFATGLFADVMIGTEDACAVTVKVVENPIINQLAFEGNKRVKDKDLLAEVRLKSRSVFTRTKVQQDVNRILDVYRKNGRFAAVVEPKLIQRDQNRVDLVYEINEGPLTKIKKIFFIGNKAFSDSKLEETVRSEEARWYKFFTADDKYDPDRLNFDQELLRRFYMARGYADFQVKSAVAELSPDKDGFYLTFTIEEGEVYTFGDIAVDSRLPDVKSEALQPLVLTETGKTFNNTLVEDSVDALVKRLGDEGFAFIDVDPKFKKDAATKVVNVTYNVGEGPRVYVERINIHGNVRTLDKVIRREFRLAEGDPFNTTRLKRSEQRINNLGFFETAKVTTKPGSAPDRAEIDVDVAEKSTGELTFGAGYSSIDGLLGEVGIRENNFLGKGQVIKLKTTVATERQEIDFGFTEPYFMDREVAAGFDLFKTRQDYRTQSSFDRESTGLVLRTSYPWSENVRHALRYSIRTDDITNIQPFASRFIRDQEGETTTSLVGHDIVLDKRDNKFDPTEGYYFRISQDVAGLGGDVSFFRTEGNASYYHEFAEQWVFRLAGSGGFIKGLGEDVRIKDRFFVGGSNFRGFDRGGIGPRDRTTDDSLGGNLYYVTTVEQGFPIGLPEDLGIASSVFIDMGNLWEVDDTGPEVLDADMLRLSAGIGFFWRSPFGPIRLDFAYPIKKDNKDDIENVNFSFGTRF